MTDLESKFSSKFYKYGGIFNPSQLGPEAEAFFSEVKKMAQNMLDESLNTPQVKAVGAMPYIYFNFIDSPKFNASAAISDDTYFIGLNYGTVLLLWDTFNRIFSHKELATNIGDIELEETPEPREEFQGFYDQLPYFYETGVLMPAIPKDPLRRQIARIYTLYALNFLVRHELAHVRYGVRRQMKVDK